MTFKTALFAMSLAAPVALATLARADSVVVPNDYSSQPGYEYQTSVFGNGSNATNQFQTAYAASQFAGVAIGATITGIGFRLPSNLPTVTDPVVYSDFTIRIGQSANGVAGLSTDEASNIGADTVTARSGALTIAGGSLVNTGSANPFYTLIFSTPYTYTGGDLLVTTSYTTAGGTLPFIGIDAIDPFGVVNTVGGTDPAFIRTHFFNAPITRFTFGAAVGAVPESATWAMTIAGFGLVGGAARRRSVRLPQAA